MARKRRTTRRRAARTADLPVTKKKGSRVTGGDQVLVAFEQSDVRSPYVVGALWNASDPPPPSSSTTTSSSPRVTLRKA